MLFRTPRPRSPRRGVTLVEMLVSVALLVLMMTVIVQVFAAATGAVSSSRTYQELDGTLRRLDSVLRTDLTNVTARLTPPLDPTKNYGYFEYGENSFADLQGEDCDDYVRFTVKAPEGQLFTGRFYAAPLRAVNNAYYSTQPITISSQYAEVIYFLRNNNLYRRVLLVAPDRQAAAHLSASNAAGPTGAITAGFFGTANVESWQGLNDISMRPIATGNTTISGSSGDKFVLNTLGDVTNRENRWSYSRWANDFIHDGTGATGQDFKPDDENLDTVPDFYPTLYWSLFNTAAVYSALVNEPSTWPLSTYGKNPRGPAGDVTAPLMAFPYTFPGAYSHPDPDSAAAGLGWIHTPDPSIDQTTLAGLRQLNHNPIDIGDSLPVPPAGSKPARGGLQNWWGFPTWRETMSAGWNDPFCPINTMFPGATALSQPFGLTPPADASVYPPVFAANNVLPPLDGSYVPGLGVPFRQNPQFQAVPFNPSGPNFNGGSTQFVSAIWPNVWEDDLIATGVRSFDIKAYDNSFLGYVDLGWGDDMRVTGRTVAPLAPLLADNSTAVNPSTATGFPLVWTWGGSNWSLIHDTVAHEGRIPPLPNDFRLDPQMQDLNQTKEWLPAATNTFNVGDPTVSVNRLRRVWDSWSTDYTNAPATGVDPSTGQSFGPPFGSPVYPSYPPPYPMPLRGIQIQIRVVDPRNERVKTLTIRHDFSDRL